MLFYVSKSFSICCHYCHIKLLYNYLIISEVMRNVKSDSKLKFKYLLFPCSISLNSVFKYSWFESCHTR